MFSTQEFCTLHFWRFWESGILHLVVDNERKQYHLTGDWLGRLAHSHIRWLPVDFLSWTLNNTSVGDPPSYYSHSDVLPPIQTKCTSRFSWSQTCAHVHGIFWALFACFIIRTFQLVFSAGTVFSSHSKSAGTVFRLVLSAKRTESINKLLVRKTFYLPSFSQINFQL